MATHVIPRSSTSAVPSRRDGFSFRRRRTGRTVVAMIAVACAALLTGPLTGLANAQSVGSTGDCGAVAQNLTALGLAGHSLTSTDGVDYTMWSGLVPSWDGVPLSVDVTLPANLSTCPLPAVVFNHGYGGSKTVYESTSAAGSFSRTHWNNVWLASHGYAVLTYTVRGQYDSCGMNSSSDGTALGLPAACTSGGRHYWVQFDDTRYSLRDQQWLLGRLVDAGLADPAALAVTGGSMGGGLSWLAALANDRIVCGGFGWEPANGSDPCAGQAGGALVPWLSPAGVPLHVDAAVPEFGFTSLQEILLPNGRASDNAPGAPVQGNLSSPVGVPVQSWISNLKQSGQAHGFYAPPGSDGSDNWGAWFNDLQQQVNTWALNTASYAGELKTAFIEWANYHSATSATLPVDARVPILAYQGILDSVITPFEVVQISRKLTKFATDYPLTLLYGDLGHAPASNSPDLMTRLGDEATAFIGYHLRGLGALNTPPVSAVLMRCRPTGLGSPGSGMTTVTASSLTGVSSSGYDFTSAVAHSTKSTGGGTESKLLGPTNMAACPHVAQTTDPGVATWKFAVKHTVTVAGAPWITVAAHSNATDAQFNTRLWDVSPDGTQTLVTRGTYRWNAPASATDKSISFELPASFWQLPAGDTLKLEITGYDAPHFQADTAPSFTTIDSVKLHLPTANPWAAAQASPLTATTGQAFTAALANVPASAAASADQSATMDWGDGTSSAVAINPDGSGGFVLAGDHTYISSGNYETRLTLTDPAGTSVALSSTASVS